MPPSFPKPRAAYIHVPFCAHRCGYCDFTLVAGRDDLIEGYLSAIEIELRGLEQRQSVDTLFLGGGTPTHLSAKQLARLMGLLLHWFELADGWEFSVEANPAGLEADKIDVLADAGVNRVSLGLQSFDADMLNLLQRDHRKAEILQAVQRLRNRVDNISFDLIFAVPGQTPVLWQDTLQQAVELRPQHISTYGLTFEKGTSFWARLKNGALTEVGEELQREMYAAAMDRLTAAGYEQYELSNFARPGFQCRHNEVYWKGRPYYAFGPGAARYIAGRRETNHRSVTIWLKRVLAGESPIGETEELSDEDRARETLVIGLRRCDGIHKDQFHTQTGFDVNRLAGKTIAKYCRAGVLEEVDSHLRLTREGRFLADTVFVDLL